MIPKPKTRTKTWYLLIDSSQREYPSLAFFTSGWSRIISGASSRRSLLEAIDLRLQRAGLEWTRLRGIIAVRGPGGFSSLRSGLVLANLLAREYRVPLCGIKAARRYNFSRYARALGAAKKGLTYAPVLPWYGQAPNINMPKSQ